jgi:hypothetical protein
MLPTRFTLALVTTTTLFMPVSSLAQASKGIDKFVGTWVEDESRRKISSAIPGLRFRKGTSGDLEELRGPELRPVVQAVKFGTKPYAIEKSADTIAWKQIDERHFERQLFENGKLLTTRQIEISPDGKQLTEVTHRRLPNGKESTLTGVFRRSSGGPQSLVGTWKLESIRTSEPAEEKVEAIGSNKLQVTGRTGSKVTWDFSGKPEPVTGPAVLSGMTDTAKLINENTIEVTGSREGVVIGKSTYTLAKDGKTLTVSSTNAGSHPGEPSVIVYQKQ